MKKLNQLLFQSFATKHNGSSFHLHKHNLASLRGAKPSTQAFRSLMTSQSCYFSQEFQPETTEALIAQQILSSFQTNIQPTTAEIINTLAALQPYKLGITERSSKFFSFMQKLNSTVKSPRTTLSEIRSIALLAHEFDIHNVAFWKQLADITLRTDPRKDLSRSLEAFSILVRNCHKNDVKPEIVKVASRLRDFILPIRRKLKFEDFINASYIFSEIEVNFPELSEMTPSLVRNELDETGKVSVNQLPLLADIIYKDLLIDQEDKPELLTKIATVFVQRDGLEYDVLLQQFELIEGRTGDIGVKDPLFWQSIGLMATIYIDPRFYNPSLLGRLEDMIYRKSETHVIDFNSASLYLGAALQSEDQDERLNATDLHNRILEMIVLQMKEEGEVLYGSINGKNLVRFLGALTRFQNGDPELIGRIYNFAEKTLESEKIDAKITKGEFSALLRLFTTNEVYRTSTSFTERLKEKAQSA